jgi:hypothetical protein
MSPLRGARYLPVPIFLPGGGSGAGAPEDGGRRDPVGDRMERVFPLRGVAGAEDPVTGGDPGGAVR